MQPLHGAALSGPPYSSVLWFPAAVLQLLRLVGGGKGIDDLVQASVHDSVDFIEGQPDPVVGDPALGKVVGADAIFSLRSPLPT